MLSVYRDLGVIPREGRDDNFNRPGEDLSAYQVVRPGDLVLNKMKTWQGSLGISAHEGIVSPAYFVGEQVSSDDPRFLHHLLRSQPMINEYGRRSKGIRPSQWDLPWDEFLDIEVNLPPITVQRVIANFLDRETARIDALIAAKRRMIELLDEHEAREVYSAVTGISVPGTRQFAGVPWLADVPASWTVASVGARYSVQLGRMLNEERRLGPTPLPYMRNANVRWDGFDLTDVATMDFPEIDRDRYRLRDGDLVICEGGAGVGRAAVWQGEIANCYYQKSLHRVRSTKGWPVEWLLEWMRISTLLEAWKIEGNLATIPHLTAEQLRAYRMPFPPVEDCRRILETLRSRRKVFSAHRKRLEGQIALLIERRHAVVTVAVTGSITVPGVPV